LTASLPHPKKEEPVEPKPAADTQREYSFDYFYSPSVGAVKEITEYLGNQRYCWVIRILDNWVPVCFHGCQDRRILLH
jgi:hypothetical protein